MTIPHTALRRALASAGLLTLGIATGCSRHDSEPPLGAQAALRAAPTPASAAGPPTFIGRWAPARAACPRNAWVLTTDALRTPTALACTFEKVTPTDAGYVAFALCTVGKARAPGRLVFTLTGEGETRSLTLNGGPFAEPMALVRCPAEGVQVEAASEQSARGG